MKKRNRGIIFLANINENVVKQSIQRALLPTWLSLVACLVVVANGYLSTRRLKRIRTLEAIISLHVC